ncbi:MAG: OmpH family outer membrane protein [Taibaiella sp.]|nr:OmpH family outer membrane protein [Taibaiella sp.]
MKNLALVLSSLSFIGVLALGGMYLSGKNTSGKEAVIAAPVRTAGGANIAYVDIDSLEAKYVLLKTKREDFKRRQGQMENELQRSYGQLQSDANEVQKKAQSNTLTQAEYEAAQKRLMQMQQTLESRKQSLTEQLMKEQEDFNTDLKKRLDAFLAEYNKTQQYDFIMSYSGSGAAILYANHARDITNDVVDGMNNRAKSEENKK